MNHSKGVPLQGFKGFKLKGNCQILFKTTFKAAVSKPITVKKEDEVKSPSKEKTAAVLNNQDSPNKKSDNAQNVEKLEPIPKLKIKLPLPELTVDKDSNKNVTTPEKRGTTSKSKNLSNHAKESHRRKSDDSSHQEHVDRHRSPSKRKRSCSHDKSSRRVRSRSRSRDRRRPSSDHRSPRRRSENRRQVTSRKRHISRNGSLDSSSGDENARKSHNQRKPHKHRTPEKSSSKKSKLHTSFSDSVTSPLPKDLKPSTDTEDLKSPTHQKENTGSSKGAHSAVPLASIKSWMGEVQDEEEETDLPLAASDNDGVTEDDAKYVQHNKETRNVFDCIYATEGNSPKSKVLQNKVSSDILGTDVNIKAEPGVNHSPAVVQTISENAELISSNKPDKSSVNNVLSDNVAPSEKTQETVNTNTIPLLPCESNTQLSVADRHINEDCNISSSNSIEETSSNKVFQNNNSVNDSEVENTIAPKQSMQNGDVDFQTEPGSVGLFEKLNSDLLHINTPPLCDNQRQCETSPKQVPMLSPKFGTEDGGNIPVEPSNNVDAVAISSTETSPGIKSSLPAKKRWFKAIEEEEKRKIAQQEAIERLHSQNASAVEQVEIDSKESKANIENKSAIPDGSQSPESPLFSGSESPIHGPQMTAFDDLSSASGTEDNYPVAEIRIPVDEDDYLGKDKSSAEVVVEDQKATDDSITQQIALSPVDNISKLADPAIDSKESELKEEITQDDSATDDGCRRSARIKTKQKPKPRIFRINSELASIKASQEDSAIDVPKEENIAQDSLPTVETKSNIEAPTTLAENQPPHFEAILENVYLSDKKKSRVRKEIRRMVCECATLEDDGSELCGDNCLNRLLMIECSSRCQFGDSCTNKRFQRRQYEPTEVFQTSWKGWGLQASADILPGNLVMEYCGEVFDQYEFDRRSRIYAQENQQHFYFMALSQDEIIDASYKGNSSRFINHSCDPNCETQKWTVNGRLRVGFFSIKEIQKGEEITFDYQFQNYGKQAQVCYCGTSKCRGFLGKVPTDEDVAKWRKWEEMLPLNQEQDQKVIKKKKKRGFEVGSLECEISSLMNGLQFTKEVLVLARLMVRCETTEQRLMCLKVICKTESQPCLRSFLQLHGLPLLWSWMVDVSGTSASDGDSSSLSLRVEILNTLQVLPITNKNILEDSKVLSMVKRWAEEEQTEPEAMQVDDVKPVEDSPTVDSHENSEVTTSQIETEEKPVEKVAEDSVNVEEQTPKVDYPKKITSLTNSLLDLWKDLKEIYRIPKRQRADPNKLPLGGDSERSLDDRSSSQASSPSVGCHGDASNDAGDGDKDFDKRQRDERRGHRRSPPRKRREAETKLGRQTSAERDDSANYAWLNESASAASRLSREEHRRQFERDIQSKEDEKKKLGPKDTPPLTPLRGQTWPQTIQPLATLPTNRRPPTNLGPGLLPDPTPAFTPSGYSGNLIQINPQPEPSTMTPTPAPGAFPQPDLQSQGMVAYTADGQAVIQTMYPNSVLDVAQPMGVLGIPPSQQVLHLDPTRTSAENFSSMLLSFPQAATYPSGITVLSSHADQAIVLMSVDQLNALVASQATLTPQPPATVALKPPEPIPEVPVAPLTRPEVGSDTPLSVDTPSKGPSPPRDPRPPRLPPNWKTASDADGCVYYYHVITRQTQWDPPTWDGTEEDLVGKKGGEMDISTPTSDEGNKKSNDKLIGAAAIASDTDSARKARETFRSRMSQHVVQCLSAYRKSDCKVGRITSTEDFKHLARKLTHNVLMKEIKQVQVWEDLECNANVKHKAKEYVRKYMNKCGPLYKGKDDDQR